MPNLVVRSAALAFLAIQIPGIAAQFQVLQNGTIANTTLVPLTNACISAIQGTVQCNPGLARLAASDHYFGLDNTTWNSVCTRSCNQSLAAYHKNVAQACSGQSQPWEGLPATYFGDLYWSAFNYTCLTDPKSGTRCMDYFSSLAQAYPSDMAFSAMNKTSVCSGCGIALWRMIQSTAYSFYDEEMASEWSKIQATCGVTYPTNVQPQVANATSIAGFAPTGYQTTPCLSGSTYTVASGDNCVAISQSQKVSTGSLIAINNLLPDCSNLYAGASLCLPQTCSTYTIKANDTCASIIGSSGTSLTQFLAWNPTIDSYCSNLISGQNICVSQPGTVYTGTTINGATVTQTAVYATATVSPPSNAAHGTTSSCGKYYTVRNGDDCSLIALNQTITVSLFESINPSINADCTNLVPGLAYCVLPTADWNSTTTSSTTQSSYVSAPAPTPSGTTSDCYAWHTVVSGDYCGLLESQYGITFAQLQAWNPNLNSGCTNLLLGDAYCVNGDTSASGVTSASATTTAASAKSTATS